MALHIHHLRYNANGGSGVPNTRTIVNSSIRQFTVQLSSVIPTKSNYVFMGWSLDPSSTTAEYQPGNVYTFNNTFTDRYVDIYAVWKEPVTLTISKEGIGDVLVNGSASSTQTIKYGSQVDIEIKAGTDEQGNEYYFHEATLNDVVINNKDTIYTFKHSFIIKDNATLSVVFNVRQTYELSVPQEYKDIVSGTGDFKYLEKPTLLANLSGLINFIGWYEGDEKVSSENPYTFEMPDYNLELTLKVGDTIFDDKNYRQFALTNGNGEVYKLTNEESSIFLNSPSNLGISKNLTTLRVGNSELVQNESYSMIQPNGNLIFHKDSNSGKYEDYYKFVRFASVKPITLWYKIPTNGVESEYHIPVEIMSIEKGEVNQNGLLEVPIVFYGTRFWQNTQAYTGRTSEGVAIYNDSDFPVGVNLKLFNSDQSTFTDPIIKFIQNGVEYGTVAIDYDDLSEIEFDSRDTQQQIILKSGSSVIPNPFSYINFAYADGVKDFPFPKLKQGYTTIVFTYDNDNSTEKTYVVEFEREFLSV